jgi:hypothetical protein
MLGKNFLDKTGGGRASPNFIGVSREENAVCRRKPEDASEEERRVKRQDPRREDKPIRMLPRICLTVKIRGASSAALKQTTL